jgi:hypothetical protein
MVSHYHRCYISGRPPPRPPPTPIKAQGLAGPHRTSPHLPLFLSRSSTASTKCLRHHLFTAVARPPHRLLSLSVPRNELAASPSCFPTPSVEPCATERSEAKLQRACRHALWPLFVPPNQSTVDRVPGLAHGPWTESTGFSFQKQFEKFVILEYLQISM